MTGKRGKTGHPQIGTTSKIGAHGKIMIEVKSIGGQATIGKMIIGMTRMIIRIQLRSPRGAGNHGINGMVINGGMRKATRVIALGLVGIRIHLRTVTGMGVEIQANGVTVIGTEGLMVPSKGGARVHPASPEAVGPRVGPAHRSYGRLTSLMSN
jgi:hypothetical protein